MSNEEIVIRIRAGIDVAENTLQLWQQNKGYICKVVNHYKNYAEEDDLQQEGYLGLCEAIDHWDQDAGVLFLSYASYWIKQRIVRYVKRNSTVRLPEFIDSRVREYKRMIAKWQQMYGRNPSDMEIYRFMGISEEMLRNIEKAAQMGRIASLDVPVGEEEDCSMYDLIPSSSNEEEDILNKIQHEQLSSIIWDLVDALPEQQIFVIREKYQEGKTIQSIADEQGTTYNFIRQQECKGIRELRKPSKSNKLRPFLREDCIYNCALRGNGVDTFNCTWTSSTERTALWRAEHEKLLGKEIK